MYPTRIVLRPAQGHRVAKAAPSLCRGMSSSFFPPAPFWSTSRHGLSPFTGNSDLAPFFRMLDDTTRAFDSLPNIFNNNSGDAQQRIWQPRFDVRELDDAYELRGELPGVDAEGIDVQFTDATTLVVRGRTESERTEGQPPKAVSAEEPAVTHTADNASATSQPAEAEVDKSDAASVHSDSSYVQPTVEDDAPETASTQAGNQATPAESTVAASAAPAEAQQLEANEQPQSTYWLSERRTGSFQRTFSFPQRIDQDGVTASLKNGILNVTVPKAAVPQPRRIAVL